MLNIEDEIIRSNEGVHDESNNDFAPFSNVLTLVDKVGVEGGVVDNEGLAHLQTVAVQIIVEQVDHITPLLQESEKRLEHNQTGDDNVKKAEGKRTSMPSLMGLVQT